MTSLPARTLGRQDHSHNDWTYKTGSAQRHYCASSLYLAGMDLKALQELLGHQWLSTTTQYIHVSSQHIEDAWAHANKSVEERFEGMA
nr:tyrosine-type recombinase/integrase [Pseudoclavibacter chungangensis]